MNKQLKLLQRSKVLKTLEVEKVKYDLSKIKNSTIVMVAYDDATDKFLIGDNSGDLYVATSEYLKSLDIKNSSIDSIINGLTKSSIAEHFNKISLQEAKEMFGKKYLYYWSANNKIYGVKRGLIERLDNGPDNTTVVDLWSRTENVLSNDRGVTGLTEVKFSSELRPAFLTFDEEAMPTYVRDQNLTVRDPVEIADIMNKDLQNHDYVPKDDKYGYDMKDSNAVMKAYLGTDDLVVLSNIDKRKVIDIDPPTTDPDNPDVVYENNTPFNHNYNMVWSTIRSARLFEEFNDEANDNNSNFVNMTRHEQNELTNFTANKHVDASGLYANIPNLADTYTTYIEGDTFGDKQIYNNGGVGVSIKNEIRWSLDAINGNICTLTKRVYNSITGEVTNAKRTYDGIVEFEIANIKDSTATIKKTFRIPILNNAICDINKFEYKHDATGAAISLPVPEEYEDGIVEYKLDITNFAQGTNGTIAYGLREIYIQSGDTKYFLDRTNGTGSADFSAYTLAANATTATIKRDTKIIFKNTDGTNYSYTTTNNGIGTGSVEYLVANTPTGVKDSNHITRHTRNVHYMSGSTDVVCNTDYADSIVNYEIYTLNVGDTTATLKGSSTGVFNTIVNGKETTTSYNINKSRHITVTSNTITYTKNAEIYVSVSNITCSQTMNIDYSYGGVTIRKTIVKDAPITHSVYTLEANASTATIKREFRPVFYAISAGVESVASIYKNDVIEIDRNINADVYYTVSDSVTKASGSNHLATHTRKVVYIKNSVVVDVNTIDVDAVINYRIDTLEYGKLIATFKGSSTGTFKTYKNGSETNITYDVAKTDHISVTSAIGTYSNSGVTYNGTSATCTRTLSFGYTYGTSTVTLSISKSAEVTHSLYDITTSGTATVKRVFTPVFKTISNGVETTSNYNIDTVTIDTNQPASVTYNVNNTVDKAENGNHYTTWTRNVTYRPTSNSIEYTLLTDSVLAPISYTWKNISNSSKQFYGSSTAAFKTYSAGSITTTTYNNTRSNHIIVDCTITESDIVNTYTNESQTAYLLLTGSYTYGSVTKQLTKYSSSVPITHTLYMLAPDDTNTITRSYSPTIKCMSNGVEITTDYKSGSRSLPAVTGSVEYDTLSPVVIGTGSRIKRYVKYYCDGIVMLIYTDTSNNTNSYSVVKHTGSTATFKNTIYANFVAITNGVATSGMYTMKSATSDIATGDVSYVLTTFTDSVSSATLYLKYGSTTIKSQVADVTASYDWSNFNAVNKTVKYTRTITVSGTFSGEQAGTAFTASIVHDSLNSVQFSHVCQNTYSGISDSGTIDIYPVMTSVGSFIFGKYSNGAYTTSDTYVINKVCDSNDKYIIYNVPLDVIATPDGYEGIFRINMFRLKANTDLWVYYDDSNPYLQGMPYLNGTAVAGTITDVSLLNKGSLNGNQGSCYFRISMHATIYGLKVNTTVDEQMWFDGISHYTLIGGVKYDWTGYDSTDTITCSHGGKSTSVYFRSSDYTYKGEFAPSASPRQVFDWWNEATVVIVSGGVYVDLTPGTINVDPGTVTDVPLINPVSVG